MHNMDRKTWLEKSQGEKKLKAKGKFEDFFFWVVVFLY
jgi:hypothetical protein